MKKNIWVLIVASIFAGCTHNTIPTSTPADSNTSLTETYWKLTELMGQPVVHADGALKELHIILKKEGNRVNGNGGCNSFMGSYLLQDGNRLSFSQLASTMMACARMDMERALMEVLPKVDNYAINGKVLSLNKAKMAPLAKFEAVYMK